MDAERPSIGGADEEETMEAEETHNLILRSAGRLRHNSSISHRYCGVKKRTGLLWTAPTAAPAAAAAAPSYPTPPPGDTAGADVGADTAPQKRGAGSFVEDLSMLVRVFLYRGLFSERRWLFPALLAVTAAGYEITAATILNVIGDFYLAISSLDAQLFFQVRFTRWDVAWNSVVT